MQIPKNLEIVVRVKMPVLCKCLANIGYPKYLAKLTGLKNTYKKNFIYVDGDKGVVRKLG